MNTIKLAITAISVSLAIAVATISAPASAAQLDRERLAQCKADLGLVYEGARFKLKTVKRVRANAHMRLQIIPQEGEVTYVTCWVDREGLTHVLDQDGEVVAIPTMSGEQLTLN